MSSLGLTSSVEPALGNKAIVSPSEAGTSGEIEQQYITLLLLALDFFSSPCLFRFKVRIPPMINDNK